jgi:hypothetical protein
VNEQELLVIGTDGFGKRTPVAEYRTMKGRGGMGVKTTTDHRLAAALVVRKGDELVITTAGGPKARVIRIAVVDVPRRRPSARGARLIRLYPGERVGDVALAAPEMPPQSPPAASEGEIVDRTGLDGRSDSEGISHPAIDPGRAALREGEMFGSAVVLHEPAAPARSDAAMAVSRDEWAATDVHAASAYWCGHCRQGFGHPEDVYAHIDALHAEGDERAA